MTEKKRNYPVHKGKFNKIFETAPDGFSSTLCEDEYPKEAVKFRWDQVTCQHCLEHKGRNRRHEYLSNYT